MSNYARLIQAEQVYKEKIRQLEAENGSLKKELVEMSYLVDPVLLSEHMEERGGDIIQGEILEGEIVETGHTGTNLATPQGMWHSPDGEIWHGPNL